MTDTQWTDLEDLWRSLPANGAPAIEVIKRQRKRRWWALAYLALEVVCTLFGIAAAFFVLWQHQIQLGVAMLVFTLCAAGSSVWARWLRKPDASDPVIQALDAGIRRARVSVRLGAASFWGVSGALVFMAYAALLWAGMPERLNVAGTLKAIAFVNVSLAISNAGTLIYYRRRERELNCLTSVRDRLGPAEG